MQIQLYIFFNKLRFEEFSGVDKDKKDYSKVLIQIYLNFNFLLCFSNFSLPDPNPGGIMNADSDPRRCLHP